eukprot:6179877-Pleurochrysis_carterae.AAC.12
MLRLDSDTSRQQFVAAPAALIASERGGLNVCNMTFLHSGLFPARTERFTFMFENPTFWSCATTPYRCVKCLTFLSLQHTNASVLPFIPSLPPRTLTRSIARSLFPAFHPSASPTPPLSVPPASLYSLQPFLVVHLLPISFPA